MCEICGKSLRERKGNCKDPKEGSYVTMIIKHD